MTATIRLSPKYSTIVDEIDLPLLAGHKWHWKPNYRGRYIHVVCQGHCGAVMHRLIAGAPPGVPVDHANGDTLDNRRANLRLCTVAQNSQNRVGTRAGRKGVTWHAARGKWQASIKRDGRSFYLGLHESEDAAARAYDDAALRIFGAFARLNFPRSVAA